MKENYDWEGSFLVDFDKLSGVSKTAQSTKRSLSQMKGMYFDNHALEEILSKGEDPLVYEFYELGAPENSGDLAFGSTILYPGKVGDEYFMTKGHFHTILETAEVYYALSGEGFMLMESPDGDVKLQPFIPGQALYVPKRYAHRSINTGTVPLVSFFVFRADAGHDYGSIEEKGYRKLLIEKDGKPELMENPKWK